jgi:hypothetical protein
MFSNGGFPMPRRGDGIIAARALAHVLHHLNVHRTVRLYVHFTNCMADTTLIVMIMSFE